MTVFFFILLLLLIVLCPTFGAPDEVKNARVPKSPMAFIHSFMKFIEVFYNNLNSLKKNKLDITGELKQYKMHHLWQFCNTSAVVTHVAKTRFY